MVTSGVADVAGYNAEWGHRNLFKILEMFQIRHKNFDRATLAETLQFYIFTYSKTHDDCFKNWSGKFEDYSDVETEKPLDLSEMSANTDFTPELKNLAARHSNKVWANKLSHVFASDKVSDSLKTALQSIIFTAGSEAVIGIDEPKLVKTTFPLVMGSLNSDYRNGIMQSLQNIIENAVPESVHNELIQYEKHAITGKTFAEEAERAKVVDELIEK